MHQNFINVNFVIIDENKRFIFHKKLLYNTDKARKQLSLNTAPNLSSFLILVVKILGLQRKLSCIFPVTINY